MVDDNEEKQSLLETLEGHLESTATRLWEDRAKAMEKQLKSWGIDKSEITSKPPYVFVGGYQFQMLDDNHIEVAREEGRGVKIGKSLNDIILILRDFEK